jgi:hypothetical protein
MREIRRNKSTKKERKERKTLLVNKMEELE